MQVRGSDGTILWTGTAVVGVMYHVKNTDSAAMTLAEAVRWDSTNGVLPRLETTAAGATPASDLPQSLALAGLRVSATTNVMWLGVALEPIGINKVGLVAGAGSLTTVKTVAGAITVGNKLGGSATAGAVDSITSNTTTGLVLGVCLKTNTVAAPGTGSTAHAGLIVNPN